MDHSNPKTNKSLPRVVCMGNCKRMWLREFLTAYTYIWLSFNHDAKYNGSRNGVWDFTVKEE